MTVRAILFDKDGTLIDFFGTWGPAGYDVLADLTGSDPDRMAAIAAFSGYDLATRSFSAGSFLVAGSTLAFAPAWAEVLERPCDDAFVALIDAVFRRHCLTHLTAFADTAATLEVLVRAGYVLGCATNDAEVSARRQFERLGVASAFSTVIGYDSGHGEKPAPGQILAFAGMHGLRPEEVVMVGDSLHDLAAAAAAGAIGIGVTTGGHSRADLAPHAAAVIDGIGEVPAAVAALG